MCNYECIGFLAVCVCICIYRLFVYILAVRIYMGHLHESDTAWKSTECIPVITNNLRRIFDMHRSTFCVLVTKITDMSVKLYLLINKESISV